MNRFQTELILRLVRNGITQACGKPLIDASMDELKDEWGRFELKNKPIVKKQ
ncbi:hypothetical protein ACQCN2_13975 [Brevibacillus ginsengisoli]|uniref:hypothetical protein n=1 Tax=Brevibacillus ginsengisoli TaxID=363854 RepID=UPI003CF998B4